MREHARVKRTVPLFTIFILVVVLVLAYFLIQRLFRVRTLYVFGHRDIFPQTVVFQKRQNLLFLKQEAFKKEIISSYPWIQSITFRKKYPSTLEVYVRERIPIARFYENGKLMYVDQEGVILSPLSRWVHDVTIDINCLITSEQSKITDSTLISALKITSGIVERKFITLSSLECKELSTYSLVFDDTKILFNATQDPALISSSLQLLVNQFRIEGKIPRVVDVRFEKPVLRLTESQETSASSESSIID